MKLSELLIIQILLKYSKDHIRTVGWSSTSFSFELLRTVSWVTGFFSVNYWTKQCTINQDGWGLWETFGIDHMLSFHFIILQEQKKKKNPWQLKICLLPISRKHDFSKQRTHEKYLVANLSKNTALLKHLTIYATLFSWGVNFLLILL